MIENDETCWKMMKHDSKFECTFLDRFCPNNCIFRLKVASAHRNIAFFENQRFGTPTRDEVENGPEMGPKRVQIWSQNGPFGGPRRGPKAGPVSGAILVASGVFLGPFWGPFWSHFGAKIGVEIRSFF